LATDRTSSTFKFSIFSRPGLRSVVADLWFDHGDGRRTYVTWRGQGNDHGGAILQSDVFLELIERLDAAPSTEGDSERLSKVKADLYQEIRALA